MTSILTQALGNNPTNQAFVLGALAEAVDLFSSQYTQWAIYYTGTSNAAIIPDSVPSIGHRDQSRVSNYPVENGGFASFNKVEVPYDFRIRLTCMGTNMTRADFLAQLKVMKKSIDLYDVSTPEMLYASCSLVAYEMERDSRNGGVSMITAELYFQEIRQTAQATYNNQGGTNTPIVNSNSASAADVQNQGNVPPTSPDALQLATLGQGVN